MCKLGSVVLLLFAAACAKPTPRALPVEPDEWTRVVPNPFDDCQLLSHDYGYWMTRVVDAATGRPIPGARIYGVDEQDYSVKELVTAGRVAVADDFGIARLAMGEECDWAYFDAPGYAPLAQYPAPEVPAELVRGVDVPVTLLNPLGRPVSGAKLQYYLGCGHTPNSREPLTDGQGQAVLRCIDPRKGFLFPVGPDIGGSDIELFDVPPIDGRRWVVADPGWIVEGTVVDAGGRPLVGVHVGRHTWNHGPWVRTDGRGRFRLVSVERHARLYVHRGPTDSKVLASFMAPPLGVPVVVRAGAPKEPTIPVRINLRAPAGDALPKPEIEVWAVRPSDGSSLLFGSDSDGLAELALPKGRWELRIAGEVGPFRHVRRTIDVDGAKPLELKVALELWPEVALANFDPEAGGSIKVASEHQQRWLDEDQEARGTVRLPRDRPVAVGILSVLNSGAGYPGCMVSFDPDSTAATPLRLNQPPDWDAAYEAFLSSNKTVRVLDPAGRPIQSGDASMWVGRYRTSAPIGESGEAGGWSGARYVIDASWAEDRTTTVRGTLRGDGPWTIRLGAASVRIEVRSESGEPVSWWGVLPDGNLVYGAENDMELHGLSPGLHQLLVCAPGTQAVACQFRLSAGGMRTMRLVLPPRVR